MKTRLLIFSLLLLCACGRRFPEPDPYELAQSQSNSQTNPDLPNSLTSPSPSNVSQVNLTIPANSQGQSQQSNGTVPANPLQSVFRNAITALALTLPQQIPAMFENTGIAHPMSRFRRDDLYLSTKNEGVAADGETLVLTALQTVQGNQPCLAGWQRYTVSNSAYTFSYCARFQPARVANSVLTSIHTAQNAGPADIQVGNAYGPGNGPIVLTTIRIFAERSTATPN